MICLRVKINITERIPPEIQWKCQLYTINSWRTTSATRATCLWTAPCPCVSLDRGAAVKPEDTGVRRPNKSRRAKHGTRSSYQYNSIKPSLILSFWIFWTAAIWNFLTNLKERKNLDGEMFSCKNVPEMFVIPPSQGTFRTPSTPFYKNVSYNAWNIMCIVTIYCFEYDVFCQEVDVYCLELGVSCME